MEFEGYFDELLQSMVTITSRSTVESSVQANGCEDDAFLVCQSRL